MTMGVLAKNCKCKNFLYVIIIECVCVCLHMCRVLSHLKNIVNSIHSPIVSECKRRLCICNECVWPCVCVLERQKKMVIMIEIETKTDIEIEIEIHGYADTEIRTEIQI